MTKTKTKTKTLAGHGGRRDHQGDLSSDGQVQAVRVALAEALCRGRRRRPPARQTRPPGRKPLPPDLNVKVLAKTARETPPDATQWECARWPRRGHQ